MVIDGDGDDDDDVDDDGLLARALLICRGQVGSTRGCVRPDCPRQNRINYEYKPRVFVCEFFISFPSWKVPLRRLCEFPSNESRVMMRAARFHDDVPKVPTWQR